MENKDFNDINDCNDFGGLTEAKGVLVVISGPSGAGKGTICRQLLADDARLYYSISATTRKPRLGEVDGVNYWFVSPDEFTGMMEKDELLEWARVYDNYYGTPQKQVTEQLAKGRDVMLEIDIQGAMKIKKKFPEGIFIYIVPPSYQELENRIQKRGTDSLEEIQARLDCFTEELSCVDNYQYLIINDQVPKVVEKIRAIITAEKCLVQRNKGIISKIGNIHN